MDVPSISYNLLFDEVRTVMIEKGMADKNETVEVLKILCFELNASKICAAKQKMH